MTTDGGVVRQRPFDGPRVVVSAVASAGLGVAMAALFVRFYPRSNDVGPTAAALGDAFTWILGACIGLLIGSTATAFFVRHGSSFLAGVLAGVAGFWVGVAPYIVLTGPSDVSFADDLAFAVIAFGPGFVFVAAGAAIGAAIRQLRSRH